jgi:hypothetical protein
VVADASLNPAFATVAIRVSIGKLKRAIDAGGASSVVGVGSSSGLRPGPGGSQPGHPGSGSRPGLAGSGLGWSGGAAGALAADQPSSDHLGVCARQLARHVGPMARIFVEEAVRRVCPDGPFTLSASRALADELATRIEDEEDRRSFLSSLNQSGAR